MRLLYLYIFPDRSVHRIVSSWNFNFIVTVCSFDDTRGTVDQISLFKIDSVEIMRKLQIIPIKRVSADQNRRRRHYKMVATGGCD